MGKDWGRRRSLIAAVIAALVIVPTVLVITQQRAASAATVLSILDGSASIARGSTAFAVAADGDTVNTGDRVQTADRSHAVVTFFDGSTLEIEPDTTIQIEEASSAASGAIGIRIAQALGRTWASVQKLTRADSRFELRTPTLTAAVRGTAFITDVLANGDSTLQTIEGAVQVTGQGQSVLVTAGQSTTTATNAPPSAPQPRPQAPNRLRFGMHSPAYLVVVDPFGRACGIVASGPTVVRQIPGCQASEPGTDPQLVDVPDAPAGTYQVVAASIAPGGPFVATVSAVDARGNLSFNYTTSGAGEAGAKLASRIDIDSGPNGALSSRGFGPLVVVQQAPVKVVRGPLAPRPLASGAPDTAAFPPLPGIGYAAGSDIAAAPQSTTPLLGTNVPALGSTVPTLASSVPTLGTTVPSLGTTVPSLASALPALTSSVPNLTTGVPTLTSDPSVTIDPAVTISPLPAPLPAITALPTAAPAPPTLPPLPIVTALPTLVPTVPPTPTLPAPTPLPTPTPQATPAPPPATLSGGPATAGGTLAVLGTGWPSGVAVTIAWPDGSQVGSADVTTAGQFATFVRVPQSALAGRTYKITASGAGITATADVTISYTPSFALVAVLPPRSGTLVPYSGAGWPPGADLTISFDGTPLAGGALVSVAGAVVGSFAVPANTTPGAHAVTATSGGYSVSASLTTQ